MPLHGFKRDAQLRVLLKEFLKPHFRFKKDSGVEPLQSWVLLAHYKFTVGILLCLFVALVAGWFVASPMECYLKYDRREITGYQEELCLSYPYTYDSNHDRVYALHYRWVHWAILTLIPLYCIPLYLIRYFEIDIVNDYLYFISNAEKGESQRKNCISTLIDGFIGFSAGALYFYKMLILVVTLLVDIVAFVFLDVCLQNRFARLIPLDYPFTRWPQFLNDTVSLAFPPFVECKIDQTMLLLNQMEEVFGCSLPLMKMYDKIFIVAWLWMVALTTWTLLMIIYYFMIDFSSNIRKYLIKVEKCDNQVEMCVKVLSTGDIILLNCLSSLLNTEENQEALKKIANKISAYPKSTMIAN